MHQVRIVSARLARGALLAVVMTVMVTSGALAAFNPSIVVRQTTFKPWLPELSASGPHVVAAWHQRTTSGDAHSVWVRRSTNSGTTFSTPQRLFKSSANAAQDISVFSGAAHLAVWAEEVAGGGSRIFLSRAAFGGTWSAAVQVSTNTGSTLARNPKIVSSGAVLVLAYQVQSNSFAPSSAYTRVKIGTGAWGAPSVLPGGAALDLVMGGGVSVAVGSSRVLVVWEDNAGKVRQRRGAITNSGATFAWFSGYPTLGTGMTPMVVLAGTRAVVLWTNSGDIVRRLSTNAGTSWGSQATILQGIDGQTELEDGNPYQLYDVAMRNTVVVFAVVMTAGSGLGGQAFHMRSSNSGASWTKTLVANAEGEDRRLAFTTVSGTPKVAEVWLRVQGTTYPYALRYHREQ